MGSRLASFRVLAGAAAVISVSAAFAAGAAPASADLTCAGTRSETYSPPRTGTPQPTVITSNGVLGPCISLSDPTVRSGTYRNVILAPAASCLSLLNSGSGTVTYSWTNGRTSTFSYNYTAVVASGAVVVTNTGTVTAGAFLGQSGTETFTLATNPTRCLAAGGLPGAGGATALVLA